MMTFAAAGDGDKINGEKSSSDDQVIYGVGPVIHSPSVHHFFWRSRLHVGFAFGKNRDLPSYMQRLSFFVKYRNGLP